MTAAAGVAVLHSINPIFQYIFDCIEAHIVDVSWNSMKKNEKYFYNPFLSDIYWYFNNTQKKF